MLTVVAPLRPAHARATGTHAGGLRDYSRLRTHAPPRAPSGRTGFGRVLLQMWQGVSPVLLQMWHGVSPVLLQM